MSLTFSSLDFSAFVFAREVLKVDPQAAMNIQIGTASENNYWQEGLEALSSQKCIGLLYERKNITARNFVENLDEKIEIHAFETQVLCEMANEGLADSVEFRRLARKVLRRAKHAHCKSIFFLDAIMGEETTRKILQHLAGKRMKVIVPSDFIEIKAPKTGELTIKTSETLPFTHHRGEAILRRKIKNASISGN